MDNRNIRCAWCCVAATADQLVQCRHLYEQQKCLKSKYDTIIIVTDDIPADELSYFDENHIPYKVKHALVDSTMPARSTQWDRIYRTVFNKILVWSLIDYDCICFLETDTIITDNIDILIDTHKEQLVNGKSTALFFTDCDEDHPYTWGMIFLVQPNWVTYLKMIEYNKATNYPLDDQFFYAYLTQIDGLNGSDFSLGNYTKYLSRRNYNPIIHFPGRNKPWLNHSEAWSFFYRMFDTEYYEKVLEIENWIRFKEMLNELNYRSERASLSNGETVSHAVHKKHCLELVDRVRNEIERIGLEDDNW